MHRMGLRVDALRRWAERVSEQMRNSETAAASRARRESGLAAAARSGTATAGVDAPHPLPPQPRAQLAANSTNRAGGASSLGGEPVPSDSESGPGPGSGLGLALSSSEVHELLRAAREGIARSGVAASAGAEHRFLRGLVGFA